MTIKKGKRLDFTIADVTDVYSGPVGVLWEMLMGEQIHVGGEKETGVLAKKAHLTKHSTVLDVCSALGGPARYLARTYGCTITGLDATQKMVDEAMKRTKQHGLSHLITYKLGNALDMPFKSGTFDVAIGQDAWCYVTDKNRLLQEVKRVLKPQGIIAFTDWLQVGTMLESEWTDLNSFMAFPYMETLEGYIHALQELGFTVLEAEDVSDDFTVHCHIYQDLLRTTLKERIITHYGKELFEAADNGLARWVQAADESKVGRGRIIAQKH